MLCENGYGSYRELKNDISITEFLELKALCVGKLEYEKACYSQARESNK